MWFRNENIGIGLRLFGCLLSFEKLIVCLLICGGVLVFRWFCGSFSFFRCDDSDMVVGLFVWLFV